MPEFWNCMTNTNDKFAKRGFEGKVALLTGASRGIGVGIARRFAAEGARVAVVARSLKAEDSSVPGSLEETVELVRSEGGEAIPVVANLADPAEDYDKIVDQVGKAFGTVDILINNAAANFYHPFEEVTEKRFRLIVEANFRAPLVLAQKVLPAMRDKGAGWILNISSASSRLPARHPSEGSTGPTLYAATKAALDRATAGLAQEYYEQNIAFNSLAPQSAVRTPALAQYYPDMSDDEAEPIETMAEAAFLLCSDRPQDCTGYITRSLSLIKALGRPVYHFDGRTLLEGWQPADIPDSRVMDPLTIML
jgi:citronellol/citronellal dehydrogenase